MAGEYVLEFCIQRKVDEVRSSQKSESLSRKRKNAEGIQKEENATWEGGDTKVNDYSAWLTL